MSPDPFRSLFPYLVLDEVEGNLVQVVRKGNGFSANRNIRREERAELAGLAVEMGMLGKAPTRDFGVDGPNQGRSGWRAVACIEVEGLIEPSQVVQLPRQLMWSITLDIVGETSVGTYHHVAIGREVGQNGVDVALRA